MLQKSTFQAFSSKSRHAAPADDVVRRRAVFLQFSDRSVCLSGFVQSRQHSLQRGACFLEARALLSQRARKASLISAMGRFLVARCLLPATRARGCCCSQPFASRRARLFLPRGFHRAPAKSVFLIVEALGKLLLRRQLVEAGLGNGIWVGGIEMIFVLKIHVLKSLNPKP